MLKHGAMHVVGTMSGTSLDGVDAAVLETDGITIEGFGPVAYRPYSDAEREVLRGALGHWPGSPQAIAATDVVTNAHATLLGEFDAVDLVGFHGQTLAHEPGGRGTHQAGDGAALAQTLGRPVAWDFRSSDMQLGGQGAPLAPVYHHALARRMQADAPVAFLNLGGVGNVTWVDPRVADPAAEGALLAFDTGPANAPIDDLVAARTGRRYDEDGALARQGQVDAAALDAFVTRGWFRKLPPKSLDRLDFHDLLDTLGEASTEDAAATLTAMAAAAVVMAEEHFPTPVSAWWVTGGGRKNPVLMEMLAQGLGAAVQPVEEAGLDGDMLEAQAFGFMAVRVARGLPTSFPSTTGVAAAVGGGEISRPG